MVYAGTLDKMGVDYRQMGKDWSIEGLDGVIIASSPDSHFVLAKSMILARMPVLIEKPVCFSSKQVNRLVAWTYDESVVFTSHTRLYSSAWRAFKASLPEIVSVNAQMVSYGKIPSKWNLMPHLAAMCMDLGFPLDKANLWVSDPRDTIGSVPMMKFVVNDTYCFEDPATDPTSLEVLLSEFVLAIKSGKRDIRGLELAVGVTAYCEVM